MARSNRPHCHVLKAARPRKESQESVAWFRLAKAWHGNPAAFQWAKHNYPDTPFMVIECDNPRCKPKLD